MNAATYRSHDKDEQDDCRRRFPPGYPSTRRQTLSTTRLKQGYWNHGAFLPRACWRSGNPRFRSRLYEGPGFPLLEVLVEDVLAHRTADLFADVATQARLSDHVAPIPPTGPRKCHTVGAWGAVYGELLSFDDPDPSLPCNRPPGELPPGRFQPLPARAGPGHGGGRPRARLGLQRSR